MSLAGRKPVVAFLAVVVTAALGVIVTAGGCSSCRPPPPPSRFSPEKDKVKLVFAGDLSVARDVARAIDEAGKGDPAFPFMFVRPLIADADLFFANLECVLSDSDAEEAVSKTFRIRAPVKYAQKLKEVGIDVVSVANNHAMDFGAAGFSSTLQELTRLGVLSVGTRQEGDEDQAPVIVEVGKAKVGFLAYNQHGDEYKHEVFPRQSYNYTIEQVVQDVKAARPLVDFLVVSVHGGPELSHLPVDWQKKDSRAVIDAGADIWLGHHPHVVQPIEEYKGKIIVYSLGDFVFDKRSQFLRDRTGPRFFLEVELTGKQRTAWKVTPANHDRDYRPILKPAFPLEPWLTPRPPALYLSDRVQDAKVERVHAKSTEVCTKAKGRIVIPGGYLRWLGPRFSCQNEKKAPWLSVARSGELSNEVFKQGIWAHPHGDGPLRLTFTKVPLGPVLEGFGGVPDYGFWLGKDKPPAPVEMTVRVTPSGAPAAPVDTAVPVQLESKQVFPFEKGWRPFTIDTSALAGARGDIVVEITGGAGAKENRFLFDLFTNARDASPDAAAPDAPPDAADAPEAPADTVE